MTSADRVCTPGVRMPVSSGRATPSIARRAAMTRPGGGRPTDGGVRPRVGGVRGARGPGAVRINHPPHPQPCSFPEHGLLPFQVDPDSFASALCSAWLNRGFIDTSCGSADRNRVRTRPSTSSTMPIHSRTCRLATRRPRTKRMVPSTIVSFPWGETGTSSRRLGDGSTVAPIRV